MRAYLFASLLPLTAACQSGQPTGLSEPAASQDGQTQFRVETVVQNVEVPWAIAWRPDGSMLFTERPGRVRAVVNGKLQTEPLLTLEVRNVSESGLMGLCL